MAGVQRNLPSGTVTFLFTDVEGSTRQLHELGAEEYAKALMEHRRILRASFRAHGGVEVDTQGDAFFVAFPTAPGALRTAAAAQQELAHGPIRVRMGIHTGTPHLTAEGYVGEDVHRAARIAACGHGGQVLVSSSTAALVGTQELRDLREHRLKDLSAPERIYQLGTDDFPPLRTLHQTNLPIPSTLFLGREEELREVRELLSHGRVRLLTLTGPGGTGKTRLALQVAAELAGRYPHGIWWVPLAQLRDPRLVLETARQKLGATDDLARHIGGRSMLLLFDNFEQVVEAADDIAALLNVCPNLDLLVTSRESLHVTGEQEYPVPPLVHAEGIAFFVARARAVRPDFRSDDAVSEICRRLDDLPLALELAAPRVTALSSGQLLERLKQRLPLLTGGARDLPERQRTLRATIEWSYELLPPGEQRLFARLAVFAGGCTLEAADQVIEADLDMLQSLVEKSLVRHTEERFWMLETIREYAAERLEQRHEAAELGRRHAERFLSLAEQAEPKLFSNTPGALDRLEREHDNFRAALDGLEVSGETELVLRLAGALSRFWYVRGHYAEGRRRLESALRADERPTPARAKALTGAADIAAADGDLAAAILLAKQGLALHQRLRDAWGTAYALYVLGYATAELGDLAGAQHLFEESVRGFRELGDEHGTLFATRPLAWAHFKLGDRERARALYEDNLRRARVLSDDFIVAHSLGTLAVIAAGENRVEDARSMLAEAHHIARELGNFGQTAVLLGCSARTLALAGRARTAVRLISCSEALYEAIGASARPFLADMNEETLATIRTQLDEAAFAEAWSQGRSLSADEAVALALDPPD